MKKTISFLCAFFLFAQPHLWALDVVSPPTTGIITPTNTCSGSQPCSPDTTPDASVITSSGPVTFQSTSASAGNRVLGVENNAGSELFRVQQDGKVGVGTTGPTGKLDIKGTTNASIFNYDTAEDTYIRGGKATSKVHINDASTGFTIIGMGGGNVGIGTTNPGEELSVVAAEGAVAGFQLWADEGDDAYDKWGLASNVDGVFSLTTNAESGNGRVFSVYPSTMSLMENGGNVGIGTTNATGKLHIKDGAVIQEAGTVTVPDTGADATPATVTIDISSGTLTLQCDDDDTTDVSLGETNGKAGQTLLIAVPAAATQVCDFDDQANVLALNAAAGAYAMGANDTLLLYYTGAIWLEVARSAN